MMRLAFFALLGVLVASDKVTKKDWRKYACNMECSCNERDSTKTESAPKEIYDDCDAALRDGKNKTGIYLIKPKSLMNVEPFYVFCDMETDDGGWLVFQRRLDGSVDFYRTWVEYAKGFGNLGGEFWLGNNKLNLITSQKKYTLRVDITDYDGISKYAEYAEFRIGDEYEKYKLWLGTYSGNAGDSLSYAKEHMFSTKDQDNDIYPSSCAQLFKGAWWYTACHGSNLNGLYLRGNHTSYANGVNWREFRGYYHSLKFTAMKIRPSA